MDKESGPASTAAPAPLVEVKQSVYSDLQYISLEVEGKIYGGWYRVLADGQMELLALANMHSERRPESTPIEQARGMLADFIRARPKPKTNGSAAGNDYKPADEDRCDSTPATLGDLLYADRAKVRVSEQEWVGLVQSIAAGDQLALHLLFERAHRVVFTLIMRLVNNRETAEELTLDVFQDVWRRAPTFDAAAGSVVGWVMNQARSRAIDHLGFEKRKKHPQPHVGSPLPVSAASGSRELSDLGDQGGLLRNALTVLAPDERQMIETVFLCELGYTELAAELQQPLATVRARLHSGLQKLRQSMAMGVKEL